MKRRSARLSFAKDHKDWTVADESSFQLSPGHLMFRRRPREAYKPPTVKFGGGSVMIWGCFSKAGIGHLRLCEGRMNQATHKVVLEENLLPSNKGNLLEFLYQEWHKVTQNQCERLVESMPRFMKAVWLEISIGCKKRAWTCLYKVGMKTQHLGLFWPIGKAANNRVYI